MEKNRESCYTVEKNLTLARLSIGGATFVKAVRCYAAAVLSFAQALLYFVKIMRSFGTVVRLRRIKTKDEILNQVQDDS